MISVFTNNIKVLAIFFRRGIAFFVYCNYKLFSTLKRVLIICSK